MRRVFSAILFSFLRFAYVPTSPSTFPFPRPTVAAFPSPTCLLLFFPFFPFFSFFILILVSFQFAILLSIPSKMHGMTFLSCFRVYSLNVISSCFYLFMHSPAFLSTCVCRTFLPSFRNSVRVYMLFLSDSSPPSRSPVLHLSLPLCLSIAFFSVTSVHLIFLQNPSRHCPRHKATVRYPLEFWLIYAPIKSVYLIDWRFILETTIDRF